MNTEFVGRKLHKAADVCGRVEMKQTSVCYPLFSGQYFSQFGREMCIVLPINRKVRSDEEIQDWC